MVGVLPLASNLYFNHRIRLWILDLYPSGCFNCWLPHSLPYRFEPSVTKPFGADDISTDSFVSHSSLAHALPFLGAFHIHKMTYVVGGEMIYFEVGTLEGHAKDWNCLATIAYKPTTRPGFREAFCHYTALSSMSLPSLFLGKAWQLSPFFKHLRQTAAYRIHWISCSAHSSDCGQPRDFQQRLFSIWHKPTAFLWIHNLIRMFLCREGPRYVQAGWKVIELR